MLKHSSTAPRLWLPFRPQCTRSLKPQLDPLWPYPIINPSLFSPPHPYLLTPHPEPIPTNSVCSLFSSRPCLWSDTTAHLTRNGFYIWFMYSSAQMFLTSTFSYFVLLEEQPTASPSLFTFSGIFLLPPLIQPCLSNTQYPYSFLLTYSHA
jgi:hypothetical protein